MSKFLFAILILVVSIQSQAKGLGLTIPVLKCIVKAADVAAATLQKTDIEKEFTLLVEFGALMAGVEGRGVIVWSAERVGAVSVVYAANSGVGWVELGQFFGARVGDDGIQEGLIYSGDVIDYNDKIKIQHNLKLKRDPVSKKITGEITESGSQRATHYDCQSQLSEEGQI